MHTYEVTLDHAPELAGRLDGWMRGTHIPEIVATGCFARIAYERESATRCRTRYVAASRAGIERYLAEHTAHFRADFLRNFPDGVTPTRREWETLEEWGG